MKYIKNTFYLLLVCPILVSAQIKYTPVKINGNIPPQLYEDFTKNIDKKIKSETVLNKKSAKEFYAGVNYSVWNILNSGKVYFDGPFTDYLQKITQNLLVNNPDLLKQITVYAFKSSSVNAASYPDGHIFVNLGLIASMESEDQLAAILAHEIVHFAKEHAKQAYKKEQTLTGTGYSSGSGVAALYRYLKYSKENEQEADAAGLQLLIASKYDAKQMTDALKQFSNPDTLKFIPDFTKYFNNDIFSIDTLWIGVSADSSWAKKAKSNNDNEVYDDEFSTHPDAEKRVLAIKEILQASNYKSPETNNTSYLTLKQLAEYETINNLYVFARYDVSLYETLKLLNKYPNDAFLKINVSRCLYMLGYLRQVNKLENIMLKYGYSSEQGLNMLHAFLNKLNANDLKKMGYGYLKSHTDDFRNLEEFAFYQALLTDTYLGKDAAFVYYNQYVSKYPDGKYIMYVKNKLKGQL